MPEFLLDLEPCIPCLCEFSIYVNLHVANIEFRVPYSQRYLFNAIPDTNHNAITTNPNLERMSGIIQD